MSSRRHPSDIQDSRLIAVLDRYVPPIIARSIVERARREAVSGIDVSWTDPNGLLDRISIGVRLFAAPEHVAAILRGITDLAADDQDASPSSGSFAEDNGPASTLKPASVRARTEEPRVRVEEQPPTRRDIPPAPISSPTAVTPPSKRDAFANEGAAGRASAPSAPNPFAREAPSSRESPPSRDLGPSRDAPPASRDASALRRDTDIAGFSTSRSSADPGPGNRGVFPTSSATAPHRVGPAPGRNLGPLTTRSAGRGPSIEAIPVIPPPAATPRDPKIPVPARPTPPVAAPPADRSTSITQQSLPRVATATPPHTPAGGLAHTSAGGPAHTSAGGPAHTSPGARPNAPGRSPGGASPGASPRTVESRELTVTLESEHDIPRARQIAREICEALGTRALTQQRLVTIVSELGRNMVLYAGGGKITLRPPSGASRRVVVLAVDQGPGIANLSEIMAGRYKSRSGLGLGIVGTKRLADAFHIETGRHGTAISVEVIV